MILHNKEFDIYMDSTVIQNRIQEIGMELNRDYKDKSPLFIGVLNGAFMFASDIFKQLEIECEISFIKVSSYKDLSSSGDVKQLLGLNEPIFKRDVVLLEDIVDSGNTITTLLELMTSLGPQSLEVASLLLKPDALVHDISIKYVGFEIPNDFVVGYGMDYKGLGRNLTDLYQLKTLAE